jgi:membrane glycosyltransferase
MTSQPMTPAGLQSARLLTTRRAFVLLLNVATYLGLVGVLAYVLAHISANGGWNIAGILFFIAFLFGAPWTVLGFWNAMLGFWLLHGVRDGFARVAPYAPAGEDPGPVTLKVAVLMTLRNEDPARALARLRIVKASLDRTGFSDRFAYFILSDTSAPAIAAKEGMAVQSWRQAEPTATIVYRRREANTGFKAGNLRDFCEHWGRDFDLMLPLDADSLMSGDTIVRLTRMMQAYPKLGILQSLVVGMPSNSAFARMFQFGMRHGMRSYTMGASWWSGDCGPFWGHNALIRIAPFYEYCDLPVLPGRPPLGGHILSHDQVEAVLMRRVGYEVRVLPVECGSWEENPPSVFAFTDRDLRWCQGNMQYWHLLATPGLKFMSRFQLAWAILMFLGVLAWVLMVALLPFIVLTAGNAASFPVTMAIAFYIVFQLMYLSPKLAGLADVILTPGGVARYGGTFRFVVGAIAEIVFSYLLGAITTLHTGLFMIGLAFGRAVHWSGQARDVSGVSWLTAIRGLWWPEVFGLAIWLPLAMVAPAVLWWAWPLLLGYITAVPFAVMTAAPFIGRLFVRSGLNGVPEDFDPPEEIRALREAAP